MLDTCENAPARTPAADGRARRRASPAGVTGGPRLRVLLIAEACGAGVGRHVLDLAEGLAERGCEVHLIYSPLRAEPKFLARLGAAPQVRRAAYPVRRSIHPGDLGAVRFVRRYVAQHGPFDVIHGHSSKGGALARLAAPGTGARVVYTPHALVTMDPELGRVKRSFYLGVEWALSRLTDRIIAVSPEEHGFGARTGLGRSRLALIPNGVGPYAYPERDVVRRRLGIPDSAAVVGFVGRLTGQKAPDVLLRAFAASSRGRDHHRLVVVGSGPLEGPLRRLSAGLGVADKVMWLGPCDGKGVLPAFDVFALPSRYEGFPYVGLEALAAGLPVVTTSSAGMGLAVADGVNGLVVPAGRPDLFAGALASLLDDPGRLLAFGRKSLERAPAFSARDMVSKTLALYNGGPHVEGDAFGPADDAPAFRTSQTPPAANPERRSMNILMVGKWDTCCLAFARGCHRAGVNVFFFDTTGSPAPWQGYTRCLAGGGDLRDAPGGPEDVIRAVTEYARFVEADAMIASPDEPFLIRLAAARSSFEPRCKLLAPSADTLAALYSKKRQAEEASAAGFDVLPTWFLSGPGDERLIPDDGFPAVLRPDRPALVDPPFRFRLIHDRGQLARFLGEFRSLGAPLVAQPLRKLPNLLVHAVRSEGGEVLAMEAFLGLRKYRGYTLSMRRTPMPPGVGECCRRLADRLDIVGCFHFDLLYSPGDRKAHYLEVNARMGGSTDKVTRLGFDEPGLTLAAFGIRPPGAGAAGGAAAPVRGCPVTNKRGLLGMLLTTAFRGGLTELDFPEHHSRSLLQSLYELSVSRDSVFDWRDLRGSFWYYRKPRARFVGGFFR